MDRRYLGPLLVSLTSLATSGGVSRASASISVLHCDLTDDDLAILVRVAERLDLDLVAVEVTSDEGRFPVTDWVSDAAYLRLRLADGARGARRVLYLDCDLVAVQPVVPLLEWPLHATVAAARSPANPVLEGGKGLPGFEALALPGDREYFSTGVLVVDVDRWVAEGVAERCVRFLLDAPQHVRFWDQCALNYVLDDAWDRLPQEWNAVPLSMYLRPDMWAFEHVIPLDDVLAIENRAKILHFAGPLKPWHPGFPDTVHRRTYLSFVNHLDVLLGSSGTSAELLMSTPDHR